MLAICSNAAVENVRLPHSSKATEGILRVAKDGGPGGTLRRFAPQGKLDQRCSFFSRLQPLISFSRFLA
ncbi:MAG: hypothetical protein Greene041662_830 [Candidatus Peregrinibacteria bacterium Greene0416_62]|nr:MAG: hypothetical protein Greene041662_830 [Candidatus Peregrinibacteria bacterium Greene0416_62]TSD00146.1 MAG: hypothetical protein Greene101449_307 [Candidatus Peregrinibacteria bacterium Greene1014_49]